MDIEYSSICYILLKKLYYNARLVESFYITNHIELNTFHHSKGEIIRVEINNYKFLNIIYGYSSDIRHLLDLKEGVLQTTLHGLEFLRQQHVLLEHQFDSWINVHGQVLWKLLVYNRSRPVFEHVEQAATSELAYVGPKTVTPLQVLEMCTQLNSTLLKISNY